MAFDPMMLQMLTSMMGKGNINQNNNQNQNNNENVSVNTNGTNAENKTTNNNFDVEKLTKLMSGMQSGDTSSLFSMLPQNENTNGIMQLAKILPSLMGKNNNSQSNQNNTTVQSTENDNQTQNNTQNQEKSNSYNEKNHFEAVNGFCGNEVNSALSKLFNNK